MIRNFLIVAGGTGSRMGAEIPKQFLEIGGKPILLLSLERIRLLAPGANIILVLPKGQHNTWRSICKAFHCNITHLVADGGKTRFHSVKNGLSMIQDDEEGLTAIHDGVRPFVTQALLERLTLAAAAHGNAIPAVNVPESLRKITPTGNTIVNREKYFLVQTPQLFRTQAIRKAYQCRYSARFTDDASVFENLGEKIFIVPGIKENIKITSPIDLILAESILGSEAFQD